MTWLSSTSPPRILQTLKESAVNLGLVSYVIDKQASWTNLLKNLK
jgi:hypothetical protein